MRKRYSHHRQSQPFSVEFNSNKTNGNEIRNNFFVSQIVYPKYLAECNDLSYLIGWNTEQFDCTIAAIIPVTTFDPNPVKCSAIISEGIHGVFQSPHYPLSHVKWQGNQLPMILGIYRPHPDPTPNEQQQVDSFAQQFQSNGIWITLAKESSVVSSNSGLKLQSIFSLGYRYETVCYLMEYEPLHCHHFYQIVTTAYYPRQFLFPTYFLTTTQTDLLKYINIEKKVDSDLSSLLHMTASTHATNKKQAVEKRSAPMMKMENIRIILTQLNASEMFLFLLFSRLEGSLGKSLASLLQANSTMTEESKQYLRHYLQQINYLQDNQKKLSLYTIMISLLTYLVMVWTYFVLILEALLRMEIPFIRTILYFCDWKEIAPAQVTIREHNLKSNLDESEKKNHSSPSLITPLINYLARCFSVRQWYQRAYSSLPSLSTNTVVTDSPYALYRFSFFFNELIQTIDQYHLLLELFHELFNGTPDQSNANISTSSSLSHSASSTSNLSNPSFSRKYYYLQIMHHLIYLILNAVCGFCISYYLHQIDQQLFLQRIINGFHTLHQVLITDSLHWIESSPLGIKLNAYFVEKVNYLIQLVMHYYYTYFLVHYYYYRYSLFFFQFFFLYFPFSGITYQISLILDLIMMMSLPLSVCYFIFTAMFHFHCHLLSSLWLFFQGRKYNIFRRRIDTYVFTTNAFTTSTTDGYQSYYHANQLLFGVLLFSIMFFLLPTILIFYCYFLVVRMGMIVSYFAGWNLMMILKKFPVVYYCNYIMDYVFFTNRWQLEVSIPPQSIVGQESVSRETMDKTVGMMKQRKTKNIGGIQRGGNHEVESSHSAPRVKNGNLTEREAAVMINRVESSDQSHPSEVSTDSETNEQRDRDKKEKKILSIQPPSTASLLLRRPGHMILPDYPSPSHQKLRNRKNLMISLTEKYRQEELEEEEARPLGSTSLFSSHSPDLYSISSVAQEDHKGNDSVSETSPVPDAKHDNIENDRERRNESPLFKSSLKDDGDVEVTEASDRKQDGHQLDPFSDDYSDELSLAEETRLDHTDITPLVDTPSVPPLPFPSTPSSASTTTILSKGYSIDMKFIPVPFQLHQLVLATITLFFTSPFHLLNEIPQKYSLQSMTTRQKIIKFLQTILFSYPLYVIFEHNTLRLTIFTANRDSEPSGNDRLVVIRKPIYDLVSPPTWSSPEEQKANPFHYYYRQRLLAIILMIYSFYFCAFIFGIILLMYYHTNIFQCFMWFGSNNLSHSNYEELKTLELPSSKQRALTTLFSQIVT